MPTHIYVPTVTVYIFEFKSNDAKVQRFNLILENYVKYYSYCMSIDSKIIHFAFLLYVICI